MLQLWKEGPFGRELSRTQEVQPLWQEGSFSKRLLRKHPERKPTAERKEAKLNLPSLMEEAKVGEKMEGRRKEEEKETSFEELMGKKNKMTRI